MGLNAQTAVPVFTAGQVLTAAQVTQINTGIPVFATTTTRDAAFGGAGEKVLAQGQTCYIEATSSYQTYDGSAWQSLNGLTLIKSQTIGAGVSSVTVTGAFNSTYENYKVIISGGVGSTTSFMNLTLGSAASGYYKSGVFVTYASTTVNGVANSNLSSWTGIVETNVDTLSASFELFCPNLAKNTILISNQVATRTTGYGAQLSGYLADTTQYTAFTLTANAGTVTGGTIRVYGYQNS